MVFNKMMYNEISVTTQIKKSLYYCTYMSHSKDMNFALILLVILFLSQFCMLCDANGESAIVGHYEVVAKLVKDAKLAQNFENVPSNPEEKSINDEKIQR